MRTTFRILSSILFLLLSLNAGASTLSLMTASMVSVPAMNSVSPNTFGHVKGAVGEALTDYDYIGRLAKEWRGISPRTGAQGLDHIALQFDSNGILKDVLVVETKYTNKKIEDALGDTLDGKQMSRNWVSERIKKDVVSTYREYIDADVEATSSIISFDVQADEGVIKKVYIDGDSYYYTDADGNKCFYSPTKNMRDDRTLRVKRAQATSDNLLRYANQPDIRRIVVRYEQCDDGVLIREVYSVKDGIKDSYRTISLEQKESAVVSGDNLAKVLDTMDYKEAVASLYNIQDDSVLKNMSNEQLLRLSRGLDAETLEIITLSKANSRQLALKLGLNEDTSFKNLSLTDAQLKELTRASSLDDITDIDVVKKLQKRSNVATAKQIGTHAGMAFGIGSVMNIFQQAYAEGWNNVNFFEVGRVGVMTAGVSFAEDVAEGLATGLIKSTLKNTRVVAKVVMVTPFVIDAAFDVGMVAYKYFRGGYSYTSQAISEGALNIAFDVAGGIATYAVMGSALGSIGGPAGTVVGFVVAIGIGTVVSFGSQYVAAPISKALEVKGLWKDIDEDLFNNVSSWSDEHLYK